MPFENGGPLKSGVNLAPVQIFPQSIFLVGAQGNFGKIRNPYLKTKWDWRLERLLTVFGDLISSRCPPPKNRRDSNFQ
jgi:hypothetical protein